MNPDSLTPIERMEPPFWYSGMHLSELQILFYGKNIAKFQVSVSNSIAIINVKRTENSNYIFVTIDTKNVPELDFIFTFSSNNTIAFTQMYSLRKRRENSAQRQSFDASDMMYLLMPDRFSNGNGLNNNDFLTTEKYNRVEPEGRHGGDIQGIINHLDYIKELGATTIWITPLCEDNDAICSYHTYAQSDVYKIDPRFGTNEEYVRLAAEMHQMELKLVMDYVFNHWGLEHWMIKDLPTPDWMNQFENYTQTNHKRSLAHDIHGSKIDTKECFDGWFVPSMPDLNQRNPLVLQYLKQNAIWWIEYANIDGFRVDTYNYGEPDAVAKWTKAITDEYPNFNIVGEISMRQQAQLSYWQKDSVIGKIQNFNSNLPSVMDFILSDKLLLIFNEDEGSWGRGMMRIYDNFANDFLYPNPNNLLIFAENHDTHRLNQNYCNDLRKYQMAMAVLATARGIPQLYYGSEVGMNGNKDNGDAYIRYDFPGGWVEDENNAFTKEGRTPMQNQYFDYTAQLFQWRKTKAVVHFGKMTHYIPEDNCYIYFRHNDAESVMVIFNNTNENKTIKTDRFKENIGKYTHGKDVITAVEFDITNEISIESKSVLILELNQQISRKTLVIAHRGASAYEPENTLIAFEKAIELKSDGIELDVHLSSDGELVVIHDETINQTTNGKGEVNKMTLKELKSFKINDSQEIPTLIEVLNLVNKKCFINIELKGIGTAKPVLDIINQYVKDKNGHYNDFLISSFDWNMLAETRLLNHEIRIGVLTDNSIDEALAFAKKTEAFSIHPDYVLLTKENVALLKESGFEVFPWTVNAEEDIQKIKSFNVNGIISNFPDKI